MILSRVRFDHDTEMPQFLHPSDGNSCVSLRVSLDVFAVYPCSVDLGVATRMKYGFLLRVCQTVCSCIHG